METVTSLFFDEKPKTSEAAAPAKVSKSIQSAMTDKLIEKLLTMALPVESTTITDRVEAGKERPGLSVQIMSKNFIDMNSRLGIPFMLIDEIIRFTSWKEPSYTLCMLLLISHVILKPQVALAMIPLGVCFGVMVPAYMALHPADPDSEFNVPAKGPPTHRPQLPQPVSELSRDFLVNLTDLQNHMVFYTWIWDRICETLLKFAFFTNISVSVVAFVGLLGVGLTILVFPPPLMCIQVLLVALIWTGAILMHPLNRDWFWNMVFSEETRLGILTVQNKHEHILEEIYAGEEPQEQREVEIFEVQFEVDKEWKLCCFTNEDYTLFSPSRIQEKDLKGVEKLEDVQPPVGWQFVTKWATDMKPDIWVTQSLVHYVDIDPETKWVYDADIHGGRGEWRRRRWTRICSRETSLEEDDEETESDSESDVEPGDADTSIDTSFGHPISMTTSNASVSSVLTTNSIRSQSKAVKSLTELFKGG